MFLPLVFTSFFVADAHQNFPVKNLSDDKEQTFKDLTPNIGVKPRQKMIMPESSDGLQASFSIKGIDSEEVIWSEDFEASSMLPSGWLIDPTQYAKWSFSVPSTSSYNDSPNIRSLFIDGDYRVYNREISSATSCQLEIPSQATFRAFIYFAQNWDDYCRLIISASTDNFENEITELWNSKDETGERTSRWHPIEASLAQFAGKTIRLRFTYTWGANDEIFKTGGYMGNFYIDGLSISAPGQLKEINVMTGEPIDFIDTSIGNIASWQWDFPGGTPQTSAQRNPTVFYTVDGDYDVSLTVTGVDGAVSTFTYPNLVSVTGYAPTAKIAISNGFKYYATNNPMVAPLANVTFVDASDGYPTDHSWTFEKYNPVSGELVVSEKISGPEVTKSFEYLDDWDLTLEVSNQHGSSTAKETVTAQYSGYITNTLKSDVATTFDMEDWGVFPGSTAHKVKITKYAEKFSKPTAPILIEGVNVYFKDVIAEDLTSQIQNVGVHLCKSENGLPGERIDSWWWMVYELKASPDLSTPVWFPFTDFPIVDDEFFIVIDGLPEYVEDDNAPVCVSMYMADFRGEGNSTWMYKEDKWVDVSTYFPAGKNHTSLLVYPLVHHSVMASSEGVEPYLEFDREGGQQTFSLFSYLGYETPVETGDDWVRVVNEPNGYTVDDLVIECDPLPAGVKERETTVTPTDGASSYVIRVHQNDQSGSQLTISDDDSRGFKIDGLTVSTVSGGEITLFNLQGSTLAQGSSVTAPVSGVYIVEIEGKSSKVILK